MQKPECLSGEALEIAVKRREGKSKGEKERYKHLNAAFQRIARKDKKAEDIKKRWQEYTEEVYKKDLNDLDNHDGVITHLEPDIDLNQGPTPWSPLLPVPVLQRRTKTEPSKDSNTLLSK